MALWILAAALAALIFVKVVLGSIRISIPRIGTISIPGVGAAARWVEGKLLQWVRANTLFLARWFTGIGASFSAAIEGLADVSTALAQRINHYVSVEAPAILAARLRPIAGIAVDAWSATLGITARLDRTLPRLAARARALEQAVFGEIRGWVRWARDVAIPALMRRVQALERLHETVVMPRIRAGEAAIDDLFNIELPKLRADMLAKLGVLAAGLAALRALVLGRVMEAVKDVERCRTKLRRQCTMTDQDFEGYFDFVLPLVNLSAILFIVREGVRVSETIADAVEDTLR